MKCKCCGEEARWCGDGGASPESDAHDCDHIHCDHCGMHYSLEISDGPSTIEEMRALMMDKYGGDVPAIGLAVQ